MIPEIEVSISEPPNQRWRLSNEHARWARELIQKTVDELGDVAVFQDELTTFATNFVDKCLADEVRDLAIRTNSEYAEVLASNLYYDFIKLFLGCTAFAVNTENGPIHARNMDWFSHGNCLSEFTTILNFHENGQTRFRAIGWPGSVGVLSSIVPNRFTVTLNAVLSDEPMQMATSVTFLLREVCQHATDFDEAVNLLATTPITSDCLLLVTGTRAGEMVVIERTPSRHAIRTTNGNYIIVTNDYRQLGCQSGEAIGEIYDSTCSRFEAVEQCLEARLPQSNEECFAVLNDERVKMQITVQQMVMCANTGLLSVRTANSV